MLICFFRQFKAFRLQACDAVGACHLEIEFMEQIDRNINIFSPDKKMRRCIDSSTRVDVDVTISTHDYL